MFENLSEKLDFAFKSLNISTVHHRFEDSYEREQFLFGITQFSLYCGAFKYIHMVFKI